MSTVLVLKKPHSIYRGDVKLDGADLEAAGLLDAETVEFSLPSRARAVARAHAIFRLADTMSTYIVIHESYNASSEPRVIALDGLKLIWEYGDGHGMRWAALLKVESPDEKWSIEYSTPAHHGHGTVMHFYKGGATWFEDATRELHRARATSV